MSIDNGICPKCGGKLRVEDDGNGYTDIWCDDCDYIV